MPEGTDQFAVRPTLKWAYFTLLLATAAVGACDFIYFRFLNDWPPWVTLLPFVLLVAPLLQWLDHLGAKLSLDAGSLRHETGLLRKKARVLDLAMIQSARVERSLAQRLWNLGSVIVETGVADARIVVHDLDAPQGIAKQIMNAVENGRNSVKS